MGKFILASVEIDVEITSLLSEGEGSPKLRGFEPNNNITNFEQSEGGQPPDWQIANNPKSCQNWNAELYLKHFANRPRNEKSGVE